MKAADVLKELEDIAEKKAIKVSYENLAADLGSGVLCKEKCEYRIIIDSRATDVDKVNILAAALTRFPLEDVFMSEFTRQVLVRLSKRPPLTVTDTKADAAPANDATVTPPAPAAKKDSEDLSN